MKACAMRLPAWFRERAGPAVDNNGQIPGHRGHPAGLGETVALAGLASNSRAPSHSDFRVIHPGSERLRAQPPSRFPDSLRVVAPDAQRRAGVSSSRNCLSRSRCQQQLQRLAVLPRESERSGRCATRGAAEENELGRPAVGIHEMGEEQAGCGGVRVFIHRRSRRDQNVTALLDRQPKADGGTATRAG